KTIHIERRPPIPPCPTGTHYVGVYLGYVKNDLKLDEAFRIGCKLAGLDNPDQENFVDTGPHSPDFTARY
ncbi:MAG TPA: hypothetical protein VIP56_09465, partial [Nitrososphaeraceae archaeon]